MMELKEDSVWLLEVHCTGEMLSDQSPPCSPNNSSIPDRNLGANYAE